MLVDWIYRFILLWGYLNNIMSPCVVDSIRGFFVTNKSLFSDEIWALTSKRYRTLISVKKV